MDVIDLLERCPAVFDLNDVAVAIFYFCAKAVIWDAEAGIRECIPRVVPVATRFVGLFRQYGSRMQARLCAVWMSIDRTIFRDRVRGVTFRTGIWAHIRRHILAMYLKGVLDCAVVKVGIVLRGNRSVRLATVVLQPCTESWRRFVPAIAFYKLERNRPVRIDH